MINPFKPKYIESLDFSVYKYVAYCPSCKWFHPRGWDWSEGGICPACGEKLTKEVGRIEYLITSRRFQDDTKTVNRFIRKKDESR
jgi:hypothetical protein